MERRKIIIQEIAHWRRSKVLPEQYCDFLLNLYLDDHSEEATAAAEEGSWHTVSKSTIRNSHWKLWLLICIGFTASSLILFNFSQLPLIIQISLAACLIGVCVYMGVRARHNKSLFYACLGSGSIFLLWVGQYLLRLHGAEHVVWYAGYLILCSLIWIVGGTLFRLRLFQFCGWVGLATFYGWFLHVQIDGIQWLQVQLSWLPLSAMFIWFGWFLQRRGKPSRNVYLLVGLLLWFVPDVYLILMTQSMSTLMQLSLMGKIILAAVLLFIFRKKWVEWVA